MNILKGLRDHPRLLETAYQFAEKMMKVLHPLIRRIGYARADRFLHFPEKTAKQMIFDCRMCGQCTLHFTGMTCPMGCPKTLRNGPCGGVRADGTCEVDASMPCVWVAACERSTRMKVYGGGIFNIQPPLDGRLAGHSAFINLLVLQEPDTHERK